MTSYNTGTTGTVGSSGTPGGHTLAIPAGVLSGDVILVLVMAFTTATGTLTGTLTSSATAPAAVGAQQTAAGGGIQVQSGLWSVAAGGSDPGATLTYGVTGGTGGSYWFNVLLLSYTGAGTPVDVSAGGAFFSGSSTGTTTSPAATTVSAGDWQVQFVAVGPPNSNTSTVPGSLTSRQALNGSNAGLVAIAADSNGSVGAGGTAIGNTTWTFGPNAPGGTWSTSFTVGLAPASGDTAAAALTVTPALAATAVRTGFMAAALTVAPEFAATASTGGATRTAQAALAMAPVFAAAMTHTATTGAALTVTPAFRAVLVNTAASAGGARRGPPDDGHRWRRRLGRWL